MRAGGRSSRFARRFEPLRGPLLAVVGALALGAFVMLLSGHDPVAAYAALVRGAVGGRGQANLAATLNRATPIVGMGLAVAIAFRAGLINLGGEGQLVLGALASALVALYLPLPGAVVLPAALVAAVLVAGGYALLAGWLQFRLRVPLLVASLLLSYPARHFASYLVSHPLRDVASGMSQTFRIPAGASLPPLFLWSRLHLGSLIVLLLVLAVAALLRHTPFGFELRASGANPEFARYGGVPTIAVGYRVLFLSGGVAGLVGAVQVLAVHGRFIDGALTGPLYAWLGVMVALLVRSRPMAVLVAGLFFAALQTGAFGMERETEVPRELSHVVQALVLLLVAARARFGPEKTVSGASEE